MTGAHHSLPHRNADSVDFRHPGADRPMGGHAQRSRRRCHHFSTADCRKRRLGQRCIVGCVCFFIRIIFHGGLVWSWTGRRLSAHVPHECQLRIHGQWLLDDPMMYLLRYDGVECHSSRARSVYPVIQSSQRSSWPCSSVHASSRAAELRWPRGRMHGKHPTSPVR